MNAEDFEVVIERILPGGLGLAHADGRTVMVALAAPGDRLRVRIDRVKGNVVFASIVQVIESSSLRIEPPCPYFGRCGGCDFQQLNYQAQLETKKEIIRDCLRRLASLEAIPDFEIVPAPHEWHYRARAQWQFDPVSKRLGYFESGSHRICDVAECAVLAPELQAELERLRRLIEQDALSGNTRYFRAIAGDESVSIADERGRNPIGRHDGEITRTVHGETYFFNAASFFQTNNDLLPQLIDEALSEVRGGKAVELYSGVGLFTLPLARRFWEVVAVESDAPAGNLARHNLAHAGLANAEVVTRDVADWLAMDSASRETDFLLLDPPRTGAESRVIFGILKLKPQKICYVSCDPATLARDLKKLIAGGYSIDSIKAFDMFPQTHHVETVVHLSS